MGVRYGSRRRETLGLEDTEELRLGGEGAGSGKADGAEVRNGGYLVA